MAYLIPLGIHSIRFNHPSLNFMDSVNYISVKLLCAFLHLHRKPPGQPVEQSTNILQHNHSLPILIQKDISPITGQ